MENTIPSVTGAFPKSEVEWRPGGGQEAFPSFSDGDRIIAAVAVCNDSERPQGKWHWEYYVIVARVDGDDEPLHWDDADGNSWGAWDWYDVEWWTPAKFDLPLVDPK